MSVFSYVIEKYPRSFVAMSDYHRRNEVLEAVFQSLKHEMHGLDGENVQQSTQRLKQLRFVLSQCGDMDGLLAKVNHWQRILKVFSDDVVQDTMLHLTDFVFGLFDAFVHDENVTQFVANYRKRIFDFLCKMVL